MRQLIVKICRALLAAMGFAAVTGCPKMYGCPELQLESQEFRQLMKFIVRTRKEGRIRTSYACEGFLGEYEGKVRNSLYMCQAGFAVASVLADGSISACASIRSDYHQGNIYSDDFIDVWENRFHPYRDRNWMKKDDCAASYLGDYLTGSSQTKLWIDKMELIY